MEKATTPLLLASLFFLQMHAKIEGKLKRLLRDLVFGQRGKVALFLTLLMINILCHSPEREQWKFGVVEKGMMKMKKKLLWLRKKKENDLCKEILA